MRIAQELHDVVAHNVSLIVVQAQALGATAADEPRAPRRPTASPTSAAQAMAEMHRTLKLLRAAATTRAELAPQPGLADLDALLEQLARGGPATSTSRSRARRARSPRASTCRRSGSCRRR